MFESGSDCVRQIIVHENVSVDAQDRLQKTPIMYAIINKLDSTVIGKS